MRLSKKLDYVLLSIAITLSAIVFFAVCLFLGSKTTFAEAEDSKYSPDSKPHFVNIYLEGKKQIFKTSAKTVRAVIDRAGISLAPSDHVEPALDTAVSADNFHINIYRSHPVVLIDGSTKKYVMTSSYHPRTIFETSGIAVYDGDEIKPVKNASFLESGTATHYQIIRHGGREITVEKEIPFPETTIKDYNLTPGTSEVRQLGELGRKQIIYRVLYSHGQEVSRELVSETVTKAPTPRIFALGAHPIEQKPLTPSMGRNRYTIAKNGQLIERQETYYDLKMINTMQFCGHSYYTVRHSDGAKVDPDGYVLVAANLSRYPRCSVVETSLGPGKVYDTGAFATTNPEQFDLATNWTFHRTGRNETGQE